MTRHKAPALAVLMAATFIFVLDFFIVNVAVPATQRDLHASDGQIQLVVAGYAIALASGLIAGGPPAPRPRRAPARRRAAPPPGGGGGGRDGPPGRCSRLLLPCAARRRRP